VIRAAAGVIDGAAKAFEEDLLEENHFLFV
jgi:hypothetical protein